MTGCPRGAGVVKAPRNTAGRGAARPLRSRCHRRPCSRAGRTPRANLAYNPVAASAQRVSGRRHRLVFEEGLLKVGIAFNIATKEGHSAAAVFAEHMALGDRVRPFHASSVSPASADIMAGLGFGVLVITQNQWPVAAANNMRFFADRGLLRRDPAFAGHSIDASAEPPVTPSQPAGGIFAPAW